MFMRQESNVFFERYPTDYECLVFMADIRWAKNFRCTKCGNTTFTVRKANLARDCNRCHRLESPTNGTLFHRLHFGLRKGLFIAFKVLVEPDGFSVLQLSDHLNISYPTAWKFVQKVKLSCTGYRDAGTGKKLTYLFTGQLAPDPKKLNRTGRKISLTYENEGDGEVIYLKSKQQKRQLPIIRIKKAQSTL